MTCYVALKLLERFDLDPKTIYYKIPRIASRIKGTTANLRAGTIMRFHKKDYVICLYDLFFGMMLPSGNDAATVISEGLGLFLYYAET